MVNSVMIGDGLGLFFALLSALFGLLPEDIIRVRFSLKIEGKDEPQHMPSKRSAQPMCFASQRPTEAYYQEAATILGVAASLQGEQSVCSLRNTLTFFLVEAAVLAIDRT